MEERDLTLMFNVISVSKHVLRTILLFDLHKGQLLTEKFELQVGYLVSYMTSKGHPRHTLAGEIRAIYMTKCKMIK